MRTHLRTPWKRLFGLSGMAAAAVMVLASTAVAAGSGRERDALMPLDEEKFTPAKTRKPCHANFSLDRNC